MVSQIHQTLEIKRAVPKVMPLWVGKLIVSVGEWIAGFINKNPLIAKGELNFLQWQAMPNGGKSTSELGIEYVPLQQGLERTISLMES